MLAALTAYMNQLSPRYKDFQGLIDIAFRKSDPNQSVPWPAALAPAWAVKFRPKVICDLGCAKGQFTSALLRRLGSWGCLDQLETLFLIEEEPGFDSSDPNAVSETVAKCEEVIGRYAEKVRVLTINEPARLWGSPSGVRRLALNGANLPPLDLLIASHVTYYFPNGGADLVHALPGMLTPNGCAWVVVRKRECPLYRKRIDALRAQGVYQNENEYAEDIEVALRNLPKLELAESKDCDYLRLEDRPQECAQLAQLLMWRRPWADGESRHEEVASEVCTEKQPLFSERHFIIQRHA